MLRLTKFETLSAAGMIIVAARIARSQFPEGKENEKIKRAVVRDNATAVPSVYILCRLCHSSLAVS